MRRRCGSPRREEFFVRGLAAGFRGGFLVAECLLVPQIENSLRWVLHNLGAIPGSNDDEGIEEDWPLHRCLSQEKVQEFLGADLIFELRSLLIEKGGPKFEESVSAWAARRTKLLFSRSLLYLVARVKDDARDE